MSRAIAQHLLCATVVIFTSSQLQTLASSQQTASSTSNLSTADKAAALVGAWKFEVLDENGKLVDSTYSVIHKVADTIMVSDPSTGKTMNAVVKSDSVTFPVVAHGVNNDPTGTDLATTFVLATDPKGSKRSSSAAAAASSSSGGSGAFQGLGVVLAGPFKVRAIRLVALWACGHKNPTHTASSKEEMQRLTKEHQCEGWHQVVDK